jgi:hypothetical protein
MAASINDSYVAQLYRDLLGREAATSELAIWAAPLDQGAVRGQVAQQIANSPEYRTLVVRGLYDSILHRAADPSGLNTSVSMLGTGGTDEQVTVALAGSQEYFQSRGHGSNDGFLSAVYQDVMGRQIDPSGHDAFSQVLTHGGTTAQVVAALASSSEYRQNLVQSIYQRFLHRAADSDGLTAFVGALERGARDEDVIASVVGSEEYYATRVDPSGSPNQAYVAQLYQDLLGRQVESFGLGVWTGVLERGSSRSHVAQQIANSLEYRTLVVGGLYNQILHRAGDATGLSAFVNALNQGATIEQVTVGLAGSTEYFRSRGSGTNDGFLAAVYPDILARQIDQTGQTTFSRLLTSGGTPAQVVTAIVTSAEYRQNLVQSYYQRFLHRTAEPGGLAAWVADLQGGARDEAVIAGIISSQEYFEGLPVAGAAPVIVIQSPGPGLVTNTNVTIVGRVTAGRSGVASLQVQVDTGSFFDTTFDATGNFRFTTSLGLDGSADGSHAVRLRATDGAGKASRVVEVSFILSTSPPTIALRSPTSGLVTHDNVTVAGRVVDMVAGVASLQAQIDAGTFFNVPFDATGNFQFNTTLALDGTGDGTHTVGLQATNRAGNRSSLVQVSFTLATSPIVVTTGPNEGDAIFTGDHLTGTVAGVAAPLSSLTYRLDNATLVPLPYAADTGIFDQALDLAAVTSGSHVLSVTAADARGRVTTKQIHILANVNVPFTVTDHTPQDGAGDVGVTFRPQIFFSRPVDPASLTNGNFYASLTGRKLTAQIVPATTGRFAWLFFQQPMRNAAMIQVTVDGSTIRSLGTGAPLDAAGNGQPGSVLHFSFSTVSLTTVAGTTLSGRIVDPGPDLIPGTSDDVTIGADGKPIYKLPIAGVKVFILGLENRPVFTDAQGRFRIDAVPVGDVKVDIDGRTATSPPAGQYFPELVMDAQMKVGVNNFIMPGMEAMYLPRLQRSLLQTVKADDTTRLTVNADTAYNLSPEQRQYLTAKVPPNSLIGTDGRPVASGQVGISVVPPELVDGMLPPGILQHTFDITVQAMGIATFSTPVPLTFPNVFNAAPGTS